MIASLYTAFFICNFAQFNNIFTTYNRCNQRTMNQLPRQMGERREKIQRKEKGRDFSQGGTLLSKVTSAIF